MELQRHASIILREARTLLKQTAEVDTSGQAHADIQTTLERMRKQIDQLAHVIDKYTKENQPSQFGDSSGLASRTGVD